MAELIIALDLPSRNKAEKFAALLVGKVAWLKVGLELFIWGGRDLVLDLKKAGFKIFLDLKFYDIPNTVAKAVLAAAEMGADMLTLHCQGGAKMCLAAREALLGLDNQPLLLGVTVLTSFSAGEMPGIDLMPEEFAAILARQARNFGLDGIVCSGLEAAAIKAANPDIVAVCPGIRPAGSASGDQARTATPARAVANGADYIVVGRPVLQSPDPVNTVNEILREMHDIN